MVEVEKAMLEELVPVRLQTQQRHSSANRARASARASANMHPRRRDKVLVFKG